MVFVGFLTTKVGSRMDKMWRMQIIQFTCLHMRIVWDIIMTAVGLHLRKCPDE